MTSQSLPPNATKKNKRLNANAPIYISEKDTDGTTRIVQKRNIKLNYDVGFYQDFANRGFMKVQCLTSEAGPCKRILSGNLHIDGKAYTVEPVIDDLDTRELNSYPGTPHTLDAVKVHVRHENIPEFIRVKTNNDIRDFINLTYRDNADTWEGTDSRRHVRNKRAPTAHGLEVLLAIDHKIYESFDKRYLGRENVLYKIREYFCQIVNGADLRYASIQDDSMSIYVAVVGFFVSLHVTQSPWMNYNEDPTNDEAALNAMVNWRKTAGLPSHDVAVLMTGTDLGFNGDRGPTALFEIVYAVGQVEVAGTNVTLECRLPGNVVLPTWIGPPDSSIYVQEGQETNENYPWISYDDAKKDLVITDASPQHSGAYTCEKDGNSAETINLQILAKPSVLFENKVDVLYGSFRRNHVLTGLEDKNIIVACVAKGGNPAPDVEILVNKTTIEDIDIQAERNDTAVEEPDNTYTVIVSRTLLAKRDLDRTDVVCKATNPTPTNKLGEFSEQDTSEIFLKLKPVTYGMDISGPTDEGKSRTSTCFASLGRPSPTISWLFDGQPIESNIARFAVGPTAEEAIQESETMMVDQNITLLTARREDNKKILTCLIEHDAMDEPHTVTPKPIDINFGPDDVNISGNEKVFAAEGANLTLTCSTASMGTVTQGDYTIIYWRNDTNQEIIENKSPLTFTESENNGTSVSQDITVNIDRYMDGQTITCFVYKQDQDHEKTTATVTLDIDYAPIITDPEDAVVRFAVHDDASLLCSARSKPPSNFTWYEDGNDTPLAEGTGTLERNEFSLLLADIAYNTSGKYKCIATNKDGYQDEREVEIIVTESPKLPAHVDVSDINSEKMTVSFSPPSETPNIRQNYFLQYRVVSADTSVPWHEVALSDDANFELKGLKYGTEYDLRIKVVNKYGSARYTAIQAMRTQDVTLEDGITRKDLDIAIAVSVVVTAVVIIIAVVIIYALRRKCMCGNSSEKFELQAR